jgi:hypothetical protein
VGELTIVNGNETDLLVTPSITDFYTLPENKKIKTSDWLSIDRSNFPLKKGESRNVKFTVTIPKKAKGELAGNIHFDTYSKEVGMVSLSLSLAIYASVSGTEKPQLKIPGLAIKLSSNTSVGILAVNTGNIHLRPRGWIYVYDHQDQLILNVAIDAGSPALPNQPRPFSGTIKDYRLPEGRYRAEIALEDADWGVTLPVEKRKFVVNSDGTVAAD